MRDSLKYLFSKQVKLEDGSIFYYSIAPYELKNPLGQNLALLQEYNFAKKDDVNNEFNFKLYKTKDGNWYEIEEAKTSAENAVMRLLKSAIDSQQNNEFVG